MPENASGLSEVAAQVDAALAARRGSPVAPPIDATALAARLARYDFEAPRPAVDVTADLLDLLGRYSIRSDHPRYFGLFNPPALPAAVAGDLVAAAINPQLAVWGHAPAAAEIERRLVELFGSFVWAGRPAVGHFTGGGSEANLTALLAALARRYPNWASAGVAGLPRRPAIFASSEAHLAWIKVARMCGLGADAVRLVPAERGLAMTGGALEKQIADEPNFDPALVVATAGTTAHGAVDDLVGAAEVARRHGSHLHVDAAWAGGALLHPDCRKSLPGVEHADSVTIDPHKLLAVPMGAGLYLGRDAAPLAAAFAVSTGYMPEASSERSDAYVSSIQWSRRFIGAKLFVALATLGLSGYRSLIGRQFALCDRLRFALAEANWEILNETALPLVCFAPRNAVDTEVKSIAAKIVNGGEAWLSTVALRGRPVLRACVTSYETTEQDINGLVAALGDARTAAGGR